MSTPCHAFAVGRQRNTPSVPGFGQALLVAGTPHGRFGATPISVDTSSWPLGGRAGAAGAIISNPNDLSRFFSAVLGGRLFSQQQLTQMKTTVELPKEFPITGAYGLGLFKIKSPCGTV